MPASKPLWLTLAPAIFLVLWSAGFAVAKFGIAHTEPITFLVLRYGIVLAILLPVYWVVRPPLPKTVAAWAHLAIVGTLIQVVCFGLCYLAFKSGFRPGAWRSSSACSPFWWGWWHRILSVRR